MERKALRTQANDVREPLMAYQRLDAGEAGGARRATAGGAVRPRKSPEGGHPRFSHRRVTRPSSTAIFSGFERIDPVGHRAAKIVFRLAPPAGSGSRV